MSKAVSNGVMSLGALRREHLGKYRGNSLPKMVQHVSLIQHYTSPNDSICFL